jgi:hypothetical protein
VSARKDVARGAGVIRASSRRLSLLIERADSDVVIRATFIPPGTTTNARMLDLPSS